MSEPILFVFTGHFNFFSWVGNIFLPLIVPVIGLLILGLLTFPHQILLNILDLLERFSAILSHGFEQYGIWYHSSPSLVYLLLALGILFFARFCWSKKYWAWGFLPAMAIWCFGLLRFSSGPEMYVLPMGKAGGSIFVSENNDSLVIDPGGEFRNPIQAHRFWSRTLAQGPWPYPNKIWLSHMDADHRIGADTLPLSAFPIATSGSFWKSYIPTNEFKGNEASHFFITNNFSLIYPGDAGFKAEQWWLTHHNFPQTTVLFSGHHGSKGSTSQAWLNQLKPQLIITQGKASTGFPHPITTKRIKKNRILHWETWKKGLIHLKFSATGVNLRGEHEGELFLARISSHQNTD